MLRVVIDPHRKWPEVFVMEDTSAEETVSTLPIWDSLSIWCLTTNHSSHQKLSGNLQLLMVLSMLWVHSTTHATNGHAEKLVQSFKKGVMADETGRTLQHKLDKFLSAYRSAPQANTSFSPAQLLLG